MRVHSHRSLRSGRRSRSGDSGATVPVIESLERRALLAASPATSGLLLWLDSTDTATVKTNSSGGVTSWANRAPGTANALTYTGTNDNNSSASDNAKAPTYVTASNGAKVVNFGGSGYLDNLNFSSTTPSALTVFILTSVKSNPGNYSAMLAARSSPTANDYQSGINIDQGQNTTTSFSALNVKAPKRPRTVGLISSPSRRLLTPSTRCRSTMVRPYRSRSTAPPKAPSPAAARQ